MKNTILLILLLSSTFSFSQKVFNSDVVVHGTLSVETATNNSHAPNLSQVNSLIAAISNTTTQYNALTIDTTLDETTFLDEGYIQFYEAVNDSITVTIPDDTTLGITGTDNVIYSFFRQGSGKIKTDYASGVTGEYVQHVADSTKKIFNLFHKGANNWIAAGDFEYYNLTAPYTELAIFDLTPASLDAAVTVEGNDVSTWVDTLGDGSHNAVATATKEPILNINPSGVRQARFQQTSNDVMVVQNSSTGSPFDFRGGTDEFSILIKLGETVGTGTLVMKGSSAAYQYGIQYDGTNLICKNHQLIKSTALTLNPDDVIIMVFTTTTRSLYINNVAIYENDPFTSTQWTSIPVHIGAGSGDYDPYLGDIERIKIYDIALDSAQLTQEYNLVD